MKKSQEHKPVSEKDRWWKICMIMKLTLFMCVFLVVSTLEMVFLNRELQCSWETRQLKRR